MSAHDAQQRTPPGDLGHPMSRPRSPVPVRGPGNPTHQHPPAAPEQRPPRRPVVRPRPDDRLPRPARPGPTPTHTSSRRTGYPLDCWTLSLVCRGRTHKPRGYPAVLSGCHASSGSVTLCARSVRGTASACGSGARSRTRCGSNGAPRETTQEPVVPSNVLGREWMGSALVQAPATGASAGPGLGSLSAVHPAKGRRSGAAVGGLVGVEVVAGLLDLGQVRRPVGE